MRSLCALFGAGVIVGLLPSPASATPVTLQYDLTITRRCEPSTGICSSVNIGGLPLTLTTDLTINRREIYPEASWAWFGPTTVTFDTSVLGDFANPFTPDAIFTEASNFMVNHDFGVGAWGHTFVSAVDPRVEVTYNTGQMYMVQRTLEFGRDVVANGIPEDPTSADIAMLLANNMSYQEMVYAMRCSAGGQDCVFDPRSVRAPLARLHSAECSRQSPSRHPACCSVWPSLPTQRLAASRARGDASARARRKLPWHAEIDDSLRDPTIHQTSRRLPSSRVWSTMSAGPTRSTSESPLQAIER